MLKSRLSVQLTLRERIVDAIRDAIIKGELKAGERVSEPEIARRFGISRTPVREALRQLDSEGFLQVTPRRGARVSRLTEKDVNEYYELKSLLEGHAARIATPSISERELDRMHQLNEQMELFFKQGALAKTVKVHQQFHHIIIAAAHSEQLVHQLEFLNSKFRRFTIQIALSGRNQEAFAQHRQIVDAMRIRNIDEAERLVRANAMLGKELMIQEVRAEMYA